MTNYAEKLKTLDNKQLIDVVKNYRQYGYDEPTRAAAIAILETRGISKEQLQLSGNFENQTYNEAEQLYRDFRANSNIAFIAYGTFLLLNVLLPLLMNPVPNGFIIVDLLAFISFFVFLIRAFLKQAQFYKAINQDFGAEGALLYIFLGMPFYIFMYFYFRNQMKEKMKYIQ